MYNSEDQLKTRYQPIEVDDILESLDSAIEYLPKKKDNRFDPILEPHLKLVSIVHKLVRRGDLDVSPWSKPTGHCGVLTAGSLMMRVRNSLPPRGQRSYHRSPIWSRGSPLSWRF